MMLNKKPVLVIVALIAAASGLALVGCGPSNKSGPNLTALVKQGSDSLGAKDPASAKTAFLQVVNADPNNCGGQWGMVLADLQDVSINQLQVIIDNLINAVSSDNLASIFTSVTIDLSDIPQRTAIIESKGCEFTLSSLPIDINPNLSPLSIIFTTMNIPVPTINYSFKLGTQWGPAEARVFGTTANSMLASINMISAYQLDVADIMKNLSTFENLLKGGLDLSDPIGLIRSLGPVLQVLPKLLAFNNAGDGPTDVTNAGKEINAALNEISGINDSLQLDKGNAAKVISYNDVNSDSVVDAGDTFTVGCLYYTNSTWVNIADELRGSETFTVPTRISSNVEPAVKALLTKFINNLTNGTPNIVPTDVNDLLTAVGFTYYTFKSNVISFNPSAMFANPVPVRNFFPTLATASADAGQLQVEAEVTGTTSGTPWYYKAGDASHFTDGTTGSILPDSISVPSIASPLFQGSLMGSTITIPAMIPYISFGDPTFGGVLSIDLSQMLSFCEPGPTCPAITPAGFNAATNYSLNKLIAGGIYGVFTDSTNGNRFVSENPDR